jgi:hypothetical protein
MMLKSMRFALYSVGLVWGASHGAGTWRAIAVSLFGGRWIEHVWTVYNRLVQADAKEPDGRE